VNRCEATTKAGLRCRNNAPDGKDFCATHKSEVSDFAVIATAIGAAAGHVVAPGIGGVVLGGAAAELARRLLKHGIQKKRRVFVSFDFDHDRALKDFIIGQARLPGSPFEVVDHSLQEAAPERDWQAKARAAIRRADLVLVVVGQYTHLAQGVIKEVAMAREEDVPIVQVIGYRDRICKSVPKAGRRYAWNWENLAWLLN
jgi:hypothetical protein